MNNIELEVERVKLNDIVADEKHGNGLLGLLIFLLVVGVDGEECSSWRKQRRYAEGIKNYIGIQLVNLWIF